MKMNSIDWVLLAVFKHELSVLDIKEKSPKVRRWLEKRIKELESLKNDS